MKLKCTIKFNYYSSLRKLPWSFSDMQSEIQSLISVTVKEWYEAKHRISSNEEIDFVNSISPSTYYIKNVRSK